MKQQVINYESLTKLKQQRGKACKSLIRERQRKEGKEYYEIQIKLTTKGKIKSLTFSIFSTTYFLSQSIKFPTW